ncbi:MAG: helix-turn-helix domain-containing protein [Phycisphaera sp.]|nr:helix-turn-helix domain-containing protein [Phycisphaera sp.]
MDTKPTKLASKPRRGLRPLILIATRREFSKQEALDDSLVDVLVEEADKRGWRLLDLSLTSGSLSGEQDPAGALVTMLPDETQAVRLRSLGCPVIRLGRHPHPDDALMPAVVPDYETVGRMAVDYFAKRGFRDIALVGHEKMLIIPVVFKSMTERAAELGCRLYQYFFQEPESDSRSEQERADRYDMRGAGLTRWLAHLPKPVALLAASDGNAGMAITMCQRAGLSVPEDAAVLSIGNHRATCVMSPIPISAIDIDRGDLGRTAMRLLDDWIHGQPAPPRTFVPPRSLVTRRSTDIFAIGDPLVARAVRFIWDHLDGNVSVDDVAQGVRAPRYKIERLFRQNLKRGVNEELRRARIEKFCELLRTTDLTVDELTPMVGYKSSKRLHMVFKKALGLTPRHYRLREKRIGADGERDVDQSTGAYVLNR